MDMFDKMFNVLKEKDVVFPRLLLMNYKDLNITDQELIILIYIINMNNNVYDPKIISQDLKIELVELLTIISDLNERGFLKTELVQKGSKKIEVINTDELYKKLTFLVVNEKEKKDESIFSVFESQFARPLSPMEYEFINAWKDNGFSDELIILALKEAVYNGVTNLKYIDKVLDEWHKKNIKNKEDVIKEQQRFKEKKSRITKKEVFSYDWLNDEE